MPERIETCSRVLTLHTSRAVLRDIVILKKPAKREAWCFRQCILLTPVLTYEHCGARTIFALRI
jgi:hypothetical protein